MTNNLTPIKTLSDLNVGDMVSIQQAHRYRKGFGWDQLGNYDYFVWSTHPDHVVFAMCEQHDTRAKLFHVVENGGQLEVLGKYKKNRTLHLPIHRQWFDMIRSREKPEEYRKHSLYYTKRLMEWRDGKLVPKQFDTVTFRNGYGLHVPQMIVEWKGLEIKTPNPAWCPDDTNLDELFFAVQLGEALEVR